VGLLLVPVLFSSLTEADQWWLADFEAINHLSGYGAVIAVIDSGIDASHPDLTGVVIGGADFSGAGTPGGVSPVGPSGFHGTLVASLIAGQGRVSGGIIGVAPEAKLLSISVGLGIAGADTDRQIAQAVRWAADQGADVINLSVSRASSNWPASWDDAFLYAMKKDVVIVAASGNRIDGISSPTAPATIPGVISVTAVDRQGRTSAKSGAEGFGVSVAASGIDMLGFPSGETVGKWSGSSAAAPIVSGLLALMIEADPAASSSDLIQRLIATCEDRGEQGYDKEYGYGLIAPARAIASSLTAGENPLGSLASWIALYRPHSPADRAELLIPPQVDPVPAATRASEANPAGNPWSGALIYLMAVLAALLLLVGMRNRFGRDGKKTRG
jgi:subtilisin family serine protease